MTTDPREEDEYRAPNPPDENHEIHVKKHSAFIQMSREHSELQSAVSKAWREWMSETINVSQYGEEAARQRSIEEILVSSERRAAFEEFKARWDSIIQEGEETDFLHYGEDGYYLWEPVPERRTTWAEPWEDYEKRISEMKPLFWKRKFGSEDKDR